MPPSLGGAVLPFALGSAVAVGACYYYSLLRKSRDEAADAKAVDGLPEDFIPTAPMPSRSVSAPPSVGFRPLPPPAEAVSTTNDEEEELIEDDGSDIGIDFDKLLSLEHMREFDAVCAQELQRVTKEQMFNRMRKVAMELTKPERDAISQQIIVRAFAHRMSRKLIDKGKFSADRFKKLASAAGVTQRDYQLKHLWLFITKRLRTFTCRQLSGLFNELGARACARSRPWLSIDTLVSRPSVAFAFHLPPLVFTSQACTTSACSATSTSSPAPRRAPRRCCAASFVRTQSARRMPARSAAQSLRTARARSVRR